MPTPLTPADLLRLATDSWIDEATAKAFGLYRVSSLEGRELVGRTDNEDYAGIVILIYRPGESKPCEYILRRDHPPIENGKPKGKYLLPPGRRNRAMFPPGESVEALADLTRPILLVEGCKKLLVADRLNRYDNERPQSLVVGINGAWGWRSTIGKVVNSAGKRVDEKGVLPDFDRIAWCGRDVVVIFDSDCATNEKVAAARRGLVAELRKRGARVAVVDLPAVDELKITGLDDFLARRGPEAALDLIQQAIEAATKDDRTAKSSAVYRCVDTIEARPIQWLWTGRIARRKTSLIVGHPGLGKSQVVISMCAVVSTGGIWPVDQTPCDVGNTIILSAEDEAEDTLRPRLEAAGADLSRVYVLDAVVDRSLTGDAHTPRTFDLKRDLSALGAMIQAIGGAALIVIDPISAYLGETDSHKNADVRSLLTPLAELAETYGAAVVGVSHFNKNVQGEALMRVTGSLAFVAAARAAFVVVKDPEQESRRLFLPLKNNLGTDRTGLAFSVESTQIKTPETPIQTSRVLWEAQPVSISADEVMRPQESPEERSELTDAKKFLQELLKPGPVDSSQVRADANGAGYSWRTIQRAQQALGILAYKKGMKLGWAWCLPNQVPTQECQDSSKGPVPISSHSSGDVGGLQGEQGGGVEQLGLVPATVIAAEECQGSPKNTKNAKNFGTGVPGGVVGNLQGEAVPTEAVEPLEPEVVADET